MKGNKEAIAETIENNVRRKIIKEHLSDPAYFEAMSQLLDEVIAARKAKAIQYEEYLQKIGDLANQVEAGHSDNTPESLDTPAKRALFNNLDYNEVALSVDQAVRMEPPSSSYPVRITRHSRST